MCPRNIINPLTYEFRYWLLGTSGEGHRPHWVQALRLRVLGFGLGIH